MEQKNLKRSIVVLLATVTIGTTFVAYKTSEAKDIQEEQQEKIDKEFFEFQAKNDKARILKKQAEKKKADQEKLDRLNKIAAEKKQKAIEEQKKYEAILAEQAAKKAADQKAYDEWQAQLKAEAEAQAAAVQQPVEPVQTEAVQPAQPEAAPVEQVQPETQVAAQTSDAKSQIAFRESTNNYGATNGRYIGMYQLDAAYLNGDHSPANQEATADKYVAERYGSWEAALAFHNANGWY